MSQPSSSRGAVHAMNYVWDPNLLDWVVETQPAGSGGGGAVTVADGADMAEGAKADVAVQGDNPGTVSAKLRGLNKSVAGLALESGGNLAAIKTDVDKIPSQGQATMAASTPVVVASNQTPILVIAI